MSEQTLYKEAMYAKGLADAADLQSRAPEMDGTALYAEEEKIPDFQAARQAKNMLQRAAGFICRSTAGRVMKLIQPYDSDIYTPGGRAALRGTLHVAVYDRRLLHGCWSCVEV